MRVVYSNDPPFEGGEKSIFLAGPTPRDQVTTSWRPDALAILADVEYDGVVLVPEWSNHKSKVEYEDQVEWEYQGLCRCTNVLFWVPRQFPHMMALTTNIEFGFWMGVAAETGVSKAFYGRPDDAPKNRYLDWMYTKFTNRKPHWSLNGLILDVVSQ